ncbi:MAG: hypothetical protein JSS79_07845 [Bacteroidetes bacterium]|nr:hypothetical protein [Bacteroidota bacterium]
MTKRIGLFLLFIITASCEYNNRGIECYHGTVIMSSCCTGSSFIDIDSTVPLGKKTTLNGKEYANVIQVPGYLSNGTIYINLRPYDPSKDQGLFPPIQCYCLVAIGMDVPIFVNTGFSYSSCPSGH